MPDTDQETTWPRGDLIRLRPPRVEDQPGLDILQNPDARSSWNNIGGRRRTIAEKLAAGGVIGEAGGQFVVLPLDGDRVLGEVVWKPVQYGSGTRSRAWNIGRELLPEMRGRGVGTEVMRLTVGWLFRHTDTNRVESTPEPANVVAIRSVVKVGFVHEGVLRGALYRDNGWHDLALHTITRDQWDAGADG
ncbi:GNAT family N-acetyltransferase [Phytohabitans aurantiacus]|jgi:RimJ/RimL family protein N-acetyltransferase|uniref:Acetyltransferase n=1 Tax=Phytohabitans aurantiacus TaxID=3016789 RepID=A0ABQ5R1P1_9ACTN|nr:GNAT family protein [Phytohabitans aurantiacus]GLH99771.1 acetyltransferase [Phytohabitans aurantiacus]